MSNVGVRTEKPLWAGAALVLAGSLSLLIGCRSGGDEASSAGSPAAARNVILFIGDGFGATQTSLGLYYAREVTGTRLEIERLMNAGSLGMSLPLPEAHVVTDSAAAATQMSSGIRVRPESLGLDVDGYPVASIIDVAEERGLATGIVTNMRITHATPAGFAAHQIWRYQPEWEIADDILLNHDLEVIMGGGARALVPRGSRVSERLPGLPEPMDGESNRVDDKDLIALAKDRGMVVVSNASSLGEEASRADRLLGLFASSHLPYVIDSRDMKIEDSVPSLAAQTDAAIQVLSRADEGFFLLVEGGRIDYAGHENDAGAMIHEVLDFDAAVGRAMKYQENHPDTLVIVTADHGTGGMSLTYGDVDEPPQTTLSSGLVHRQSHVYANPGHLALIARQKASLTRSLELLGDDFDGEALAEEIERSTGILLAEPVIERILRGLRDPEMARELLGPFHDDVGDNRMGLVGEALGVEQFVVWSTGGHTMEPLMTYGIGPCADKLRGVYANTFIHDVMKAALEGSCESLPTQTAERP